MFGKRCTVIIRKIITCHAMTRPKFFTRRILRPKKYFAFENDKRFLAHTSSKNVYKILFKNKHFFHMFLQKNCLDFIYKNAHAVFKSPAFVNLCATCVTKVIQAEDLRTDESKVYEALLDWSAKACHQQKLPVNPDNRRRVLGKLVYLVRFPVMELDYFVKCVTTEGLLTKEETIQLFQYFHSRSSPAVGPFSTRRRALTRVVRFETTSGAWNVGSYVVDSIRFQSSIDITLDGVLVYGCFEDYSPYEVSVQIRNENQQVLVRLDTVIETDDKTAMYDIMLHNGISIQRLTWYTIMLYMDGPQTKRGVCGKSMVYCEQVQFMFQNSGLSQNCTSDREGQIPGIVFH